MLRIIPFLLLILGVSVGSQARMYQWISPTSQQTQLSGIPPAWYRSEAGGPRVQVFEQGNLIDDTKIALPPSQREDLRDAAFNELQQRQQAEALRRLELVARRSALKEKEDEIRTERVAAEKAERQAKQLQEKDQAASGIEENVDAAMIDRLKSLIGQFDRGNLGTVKAP